MPHTWSLLIGSTLGALLLLAVGVLVPRAENAPSLTNSLTTQFEFTRTVYDPEALKELNNLPVTIAFAGPLFRAEGVPIEFIEMTPSLELKGSRQLTDGFFYASATTSRNELTFMGGGCADPSGSWANCSVVSTLTPDGETYDNSSTKLELDFHEYEPDGEGGYWAIKYESISCITESQKHCGTDKTGTPVPSIGDCQIVHVVEGKIVSRWSANDALPEGESTSARYEQFQDVFHCNSVEVFTVQGKQKILISMRNTDSLYLVDAATGTVDWKLGGNDWTGTSLLVTNPGALGINSENMQAGDVLSGQHDARY